MTGREYVKTVAPFGEIVMGRNPEALKINKLTARWQKGVYLGGRS